MPVEEADARSLPPRPQRRRRQKKLTNRIAALSLGVQKVATEKAKRGLFP